jgi:hypothetical protein
VGGREGRRGAWEMGIGRMREGGTRKLRNSYSSDRYVGKRGLNKILRCFKLQHFILLAHCQTQLSMSASFELAMSPCNKSMISSRGSTCKICDLSRSCAWGLFALAAAE